MQGSGEQQFFKFAKIEPFDELLHEIIVLSV